MKGFYQLNTCFPEPFWHLSIYFMSTDSCQAWETHLRALPALEEKCGPCAGVSHPICSKEEQHWYQETVSLTPCSGELAIQVNSDQSSSDVDGHLAPLQPHDVHQALM